ncbi:LysR family substrate-binding domain-containing protein [Georgenia yuyongxinii]|uniref:LysR family transcriptional regulator n=1 Tax=Georgenia yuyongxinii TaxID=2589797 RepID=A0A552WXG9_9MICO|nr:LysR family substrate-binding domain-containing protein [Georgenia yuyongxinii]TRW47013.1 LysR family transcriptional regulator [Georgenia yuyongxinii]
MSEPFRIGYAPGVIPDKWSRIWAERLPGSPLETDPVDDGVRALHTGAADMCFVRLPVERDGLHVIPLYTEVPVVVVAKDHPVAAFEEVAVADLADEHLLQDPDEVPAWREVAVELREASRADVPAMSIKQAVEVVAAGAGIVIVPMSVARLHHRKDVVHRPVSDVEGSQVALAWLVDNEDPRVETFVGIVRGRTARSSRGGDDGSRESSGTGGRGAGRTAGRAASDRRPASRSRKSPRRGPGGAR